MYELANQLNLVLGHFGLNSVIGLGVGAGGNILTRFALNHPNKVNNNMFMLTMDTYYIQE